MTTILQYFGAPINSKRLRPIVVLKDIARGLNVFLNGKSGAQYIFLPPPNVQPLLRTSLVTEKTSGSEEKGIESSEQLTIVVMAAFRHIPSVTVGNSRPRTESNTQRGLL